jgi:hypothetical protein
MITVDPVDHKTILPKFISYNAMYNAGVHAIIDATKDDKDFLEAICTTYALSLSDDEVAGWAKRNVVVEGVKEEDKKEEEKKETSLIPDAIKEAEKQSKGQANLPEVISPIPNLDEGKMVSIIEQQREQFNQKDKFKFELVRRGDVIGVYLDGVRKGFLPIVSGGKDSGQFEPCVKISSLGLAAMLTETSSSRLVAAGYWIYGVSNTETDKVSKTFDLRYASNGMYKLELPQCKPPWTETFRLEGKELVIKLWQLASILCHLSNIRFITLYSKHGASYFGVYKEDKKAA